MKSKKNILFISAIVIFTIITALLAVTGWLTDSELLKSVFPNHTAMKFNTALCFIIISPVLFAIAKQKYANRYFIAAALSVVLITSGITFTEDVLGLNFSTPALLQKYKTASWYKFTERMAAATAFCFIILAAGLGLLTFKRKNTAVAAQYLLHIVTLISFVAIIGYLYKIPSFYSLSFFSSMAINTAVVFFVLSIAASLINYNLGFTGVFTGHKVGNLMARRIFPFITILLFVLGYIRMQLHWHEMVTVNFGIALFAVSFLVLIVFLIAYTAKYLNKIDDKRSTAETALKEINKVLEQKIKERTADIIKITERLSLATGGAKIGIWDWDIKNNVITWDEVMHQLYGLDNNTFSGKYRTWQNALHPQDKDVTIKAIENALSGHQELNISFRIIWPDDTVHSIKANSIVQRDETGKPFRLIGTNWDITKEQEQLQVIEQNEARFRHMLNVIGDNVWEHDFVTGKTTFSENIHALLGYNQNEFTDNVNLWWQSTHNDDRWILEENDKKYKAGILNHHAVEYRMFDKNGQLKWVLDRGVIIEKTAYNIPLRIIGTHKDITVRKISEDAVAKSEKRLRDLTHNVPGVIYQWLENNDGSFGFGYTSPRLKEYFGIDENDTSAFLSLIHPDDKKIWRQSIEEANKNETPWFFEGRLLYPDGAVKWWQASSIISDKTSKGKIYSGVILDITKQKETEEQIKLHQTRFEGIFNSTYQFIGMASADGILLEINDTALQFGNVKSDDVIGKPLWECYWCGLNPRVFKEGIEAAAKGIFFQQDVEVLARDNRKAWINFTAKPIFNHEGKVAFIIPEGHDITEMRNLKTTTKEQEEQIRLFVKHTPAAVAMFDTEMKYIVASDRWYEDYNLQNQEIIGKSHYTVFPEINDMPEWLAIHQRCLKGAVEINEEDIFIREDGTTVWNKWEIHPWIKHNGTIGGIIMFTEVITEKVAARENLKNINSRLLASNKELEQFAYIASHDLQEPLRMVSSFMQLLDKKYTQQLDDTAKQYINFAVDGAERMKTLIADLLAFSRVGTQQQQHEAVNLNEVVAEVQSNMQAHIKESNAKITTAPLPVIQASRVQMVQLFQNLISNAVKYRGQQPPQIEIGCSTTAGFYNFYVKDNGIGIDSKYFEKIFVIFQRLHTKTQFSGTGVGLSICKKIAENHGGTITVQSEPGTGSTFNFSVKIKNSEKRTHIVS